LAFSTTRASLTSNMCSEPAPPTADDRPAQSVPIARRATATRPLYEGYDEIHVSRPTQLHERESRQASLATVYRYHDGTKHHFHAFAQSLGYLDWASQPRPFRGFADTSVFPLYPAPSVAVARRSIRHASASWRLHR
jgi:hypothetical protein